jgi:hypothetical protein
VSYLARYHSSSRITVRAYKKQFYNPDVSTSTQTLCARKFYFRGRIYLEVSTLKDKLASPVSRRDALNPELPSTASNRIKHPGPPRGPWGGTGDTIVHMENYLVVLEATSLPPYIDIGPLSTGQGIRQNTLHSAHACEEFCFAMWASSRPYQQSTGFRWCDKQVHTIASMTLRDDPGR